MSMLLVAIFLLLIIGALAAFFLGRQRPPYTIPAAIGFTLLALAIWLLVKGQLPITVVYGGVESSWISTGWSLYVDETAWQITTFALLMAAGIFIGCQGWILRTNDSRDSDAALRSAVPFALLMIAFSFLTIWSKNLYSLAQSWTLFIFTWFVFMGAINPGREKIRSNLLRGSFAMLGVLFIWILAANLGNLAVVDPKQPDLSSEAILWASLASLTLIGFVFLHWWRPLADQLPPIIDAFVHIFPVVAGGSFFIRIISISSLGSGYTTAVTVLCFLGLLVGIVMSWMRIHQPGRLVSSLAFSVVNLIVLTGIWTEAEGAISYLRISILATAGFFIVARLTEDSPMWRRLISLVFAAAVAGMPVTIGLDGMLPLYSKWLGEGRIIIALVTALMMIPLLAVIFHITWPKSRPVSEKRLPPSGHALAAAALILLASGLISIDSIGMISSNIPALVIIFLTFGGGLLLSRYTHRATEVKSLLRGVIRIDLPARRAKSSLLLAISTLEQFFREGVAILEGEGGMLWIFVLLIILWLARNGQ